VEKLTKLIGASALFWLLTPSVHADKSTLNSRIEAIEQAAEGFSVDQAYRLRAQWTFSEFMANKVPSIYFYLRMGEVLPQAVISRTGPVKELVNAPDETIGAVKLPGPSGEMQLDDMLNPQVSPVQGVVVVHKGKVVYERYPGMRPTDNHIWMSSAKTIAGLLVAMLAEEGKLDVQKPIDA